MRPPKLALIMFFLVTSALGSSLFNFSWAIENKSHVVSPYWQSDSGSYTFIAISHSSLASIASQVGMVINAIQNDNTAFATASTFTISSGNTQRLFIVRTNHSSISAATIPTANFLIGTTNFKHGYLKIEPVATNPAIVTTSGGRRDVTMLNFWGAVVIETNTTGFAMEFIGDMGDSSATPSMDDTATVSGVN